MADPSELDPQLIDRLWQQTRERVAARRALPESTYRVQFHAGFTFRDAAAIAPYLQALGISHCYASPYLKARPGSTHGYDIIDHRCLNPEIGSDDDYAAFVAVLAAHGLGQILDTVPNHMGVASNDNAWWNDVLENGPSSRFASYFDIAWRSSPRPELQDKILLPVLGEPYGTALESGQLVLEFEESGCFVMRYFDRRIPVAPRSYARILSHDLEQLEQALGPDDPALLEFHSILTATRNLPDRSETEPEKIAERSREKEIVKRRLALLTGESLPVRTHVERNVARFNGTAGQPSSFDLLDDLLEHQCYRLAYWRVAPDEINYRRFFDINDLAALSMERAEVFAATHEFVLRLTANGTIDGLRIDHPDGLYDPGQYFERLQQGFVLACAKDLAAADDELRQVSWPLLEGALRRRMASDTSLKQPLYVVAEKILGADEPLVESWLVHGTSGYDFVSALNGLFVDRAAESDFTRLYHEWIDDDTRYAEVVYRKKRLILEVALASELHMLTHQLDRLAQKHRQSRDFTFNTLRNALREVIACFPVYRSYIADDGPHDADRRAIAFAIRRATLRNPLMSRSVFRFVRDTLLLESPPSFTADDRAEQRRFAGKFQQVTAPVTAKGIEDTAFYIYNRLVSLNEVGGEPSRFGTTPQELHVYNQLRQQLWPYALSPLSTHDTKRSEDVRARINVLSEMPDAWQGALQRWRVFNNPHRILVDDQPVPGPNEEYLIYQTLVGSWPINAPRVHVDQNYVERIQAYMEKALHEAKLHTSWINPNEEYDSAVRQFIARILDPAANAGFLDDLYDFQRKVCHYGLFNALSQTLLRITSPGVPDTYQGTELWDDSLVDPDNRRPVDYEHRRAMLEALDREASSGDLRCFARRLVDAREDGRVKLYLASRALRCRRDRPGLFSVGEYLPLAVTGEKREHVFAFARHDKSQWSIVAVPRLTSRLMPESSDPRNAAAWGKTQLTLEGMPTGLRWRNVFTGVTFTPGKSIAVAELFVDMPATLLVTDQEA